MHQRRVVITGLGAMTPLGCSVGEYWDGLIHGRSGIDKIKNFDASELPCQIAGEVPEFDPNDFMDRKSARRMPRVAQLAMGAARQAISDAGLSDPVPDAERTGVYFGTAVGGIEHLDISGEIYRVQGIQPDAAALPAERHPQRARLPDRAGIPVPGTQQYHFDSLRCRHPGGGRGSGVDPPRRGGCGHHRRHGSHRDRGGDGRIRGHARPADRFQRPSPGSLATL